MVDPAKLLKLSCQTCGWVLRDPDQTMGVVQAHVETEHPEQDQVRLELVACCPRCEAVMPIFASVDKADHTELHYHCEPCRRGYVLRQTNPGLTPEERADLDAADEDD